MPRLPAAITDRLRRWNDLHWCLLLAALTALAFSVGMDFPFMQNWDDGAFVTCNQHLSWTWANLKAYFCHPFMDLYTPLPMVSLMLDRALFGLHPVGYHLHNLLLHMAAAIFLYLAIRRLAVPRHFAFLGALLWAVSPQKVESVIWITERKDVLCGAFALLACWAFLEAIRPVPHRRRWCALAATAAVLSILAKPATIALPGIFAVAAALAAWQQGHDRIRPVLRLATPPVLASLAAIILSAVITRQTNGGLPETFLAIPLHNLFWYPLTALYPWRLNPIFAPVRHWREAILVAAIGIFALGVLLLLARRVARLAWPQILAELAIIAGATVPVLGFLRYTDFTHCDRYNYFVSALVWAAAAALAHALPWRRAATALLASLAFVFLARTWMYIPFWQTPDTFSAYLLEQPAPHNRKALEVATANAYLSKNLGLLHRIRDILHTAPPPEGVWATPPEDAVHLMLDAHIAFLEGDFPTADRIYREIVRLHLSLKQDFIMPPEFTATMYRDMALLARHRGNLDEANFYREQLLKINQYTQERNTFFHIKPRPEGFAAPPRR